MAKLYRIKNRFQLVQISLRDPNGKPYPGIFRRGNNDDVPEWVIEHPKIKNKFIKTGNFIVVPMDEVNRKAAIREKGEKAIAEARKKRLEAKSKTEKPKPPSK